VEGNAYLVDEDRKFGQEVVVLDSLVINVILQEVTLVQRLVLGVVIEPACIDGSRFAEQGVEGEEHVAEKGDNRNRLFFWGGFFIQMRSGKVGE
jgi:hypothetical protein